MQFRRRHGDIAAAVGTLLFAGFLLLETFKMSSRITAYPRLLVALLAVAGVVLLWQALRRSGGNALLFEDIAWKRLVTSIAVWCVAIYLTTLFGFYPVIGLMIMALVWILEGHPRSTAAICRIIAFGAAMALLLWLIFRQILNVVTPEATVF